MAFLFHDRFQLRPTSSRATVPDNDLARLMYYLNCVFSAIEYKDQDVRRYREYWNWSMLNDDDQRKVLMFAVALSPDEFDGKVFIQSDELCGDQGNKFYELSQIRNQVLAIESICIAGQSRQVRKIMAYKVSWMERNYYEPRKRFTAVLRQRKEREEAIRRQQALNRAASARWTQSTNYYSNSNSDTCVIS